MKTITPLLYTLNSLDLILVLICSYYTLTFVWKYIVKLCINKKFVNMFYVVAVSLMLADMFTIINIFRGLPRWTHEDLTMDQWDEKIETYDFNLSNSVHSICFVALVLMYTCTNVHITMGIKTQLIDKGEI